MISVHIVVAIVIIHLIADFFFQTENQAINKSKSIKALLSHTYTYFAVWLVIGSLLQATGVTNYPSGFLTVFVTTTFVAHTITDYFTSKIVSKKFADKVYYTGIPNLGAFAIIGIDQTLHFVQLFYTYYWVENLLK